MRHRFSIAIAVLLLAGTSAHAQQGSRFNDRLMFDPNSFSGARQPDAPPQAAPTTGTTATTGQNTPPAARPAAAPQQQQQASKPKPPARTATAPAPAPRRTAPVERRIGDSTTSPTRSTSDRPVPREETTLGRVALPQAGSLGYESRTQLQAYDMSDGRRVPGYDNIQRNDTSYFGLSLRMPTAPTSSSPFSLGSHGAN